MPPLSIYRCAPYIDRGRYIDGLAVEMSDPLSLYGMHVTPLYIDMGDGSAYIERWAPLSLYTLGSREAEGTPHNL